MRLYTGNGANINNKYQPVFLAAVATLLFFALLFHQHMVSIILVNYKSGPLLTTCLSSVYAGLANAVAEIIVVDNSPEDGTRSLAETSFPNIQWLTTGYNAGFARANNMGIQHAVGDAVLLLNTDTIINGNAIGESYARLMQMPGYAACGVQLLNADGSPQISGNFVMKGALNYLMQVPYIGALLRRLALAAGVSKTNLPEAVNPVTHVDWINGAYLMVKKSAIEKAGLLDEDFFLYHEESEWCSRLKKTGELCIFGDLHVVHLEGQSTKHAFGSVTTGHNNLADRKGFQLMLSMFVRLKKEFGTGWFLFHLLFHSLSIPWVLLFAALHAVLRFAKAGNIWRQAAGYCANVLRCWRYAPAILSGKPNFYKVL